MNKNNFYLDFDANLLHQDLVGDRQRLINDANLHNIKVFVVPGSTLMDSLASLDMASESPTILTTCGVHPYHAESTIYNEDSIQQLVNMSSNIRCLAIGECGLDYSDGFPDKSIQSVWFNHQIALALECGKPLYFHVRAAHDDFISALVKHGFSEGIDSEPPVPCVVHCFTGSIEELRQYLEFGFYIGLTGYIINNLSNEQLLEQLQLITLDRLVIETDAPYMGFKGCRKHDSLADKKKKNQKYPNVPSALPMVAEHIAAVSGWSVEDVMHRTTANALKFFGVDGEKLSSSIDAK